MIYFSYIPFIFLYSSSKLFNLFSNSLFILFKFWFFPFNSPFSLIIASCVFFISSYSGRIIVYLLFISLYFFSILVKSFFKLGINFSNSLILFFKALFSLPKIEFLSFKLLFSLIKDFNCEFNSFNSFSNSFFSLQIFL